MRAQVPPRSEATRRAPPLRAMARAGWRDRRGRVAIYRSFERAVDEARKAFE